LEETEACLIKMKTEDWQSNCRTDGIGFELRVEGLCFLFLKYLCLVPEKCLYVLTIEYHVFVFE
jgi:hypothetical protein